MSHQQASHFSLVTGRAWWEWAAGVWPVLVAVIDLGFQLMLILISLLPAAVHRDFALHCPHLPVAHHSPVLPGVHPGKP